MNGECFLSKKKRTSHGDKHLNLSTPGVQFPHCFAKRCSVYNRWPVFLTHTHTHTHIYIYIYIYIYQKYWSRVRKGCTHISEYEHEHEHAHVGKCPYRRRPVDGQDRRLRHQSIRDPGGGTQHHYQLGHNRVHATRVPIDLRIGHPRPL